ncbi:UPF0658 Golgi apparatus membrane protein [Sparassis crispa]|uniref:UPF0658 Golgi apparatus membrane protein n=1 Tax=Sparassis crispa TaxID=139825 RepID=A0A401GJG9_9APHY|nr:UPF0658 Golgi apparatus membrane protein [Sparassis crispa]GBE82305.1 UPF0658 Golgi apparatus membrane protein [Sparassis crispa]
MAVEPLLSTRAQRAFVGTIVLQAIVVLVMVAITFAFVEPDVDYTITRYKTLPCYLALFALAEIFELVMTFDALRLRNVIQLIGILLFHMGLTVMAALQIHETRTALVWDSGSVLNTSGPGSLWHKVLPFLVVTPIVIGVAWFVMLYFFRHLYYEFGWAIFHVVGADPKMKTMYQYYQILICLLKFDFFAFTGVTMQLLIIVLRENSAEFGLTVAAIPIVLILLALSGIAVQREIKWLMSISLILMLAAQTYFIYKLVRFYEPSSDQQYLSTRATLTVFTIAASLLLFATFGMGVRCFADFDKGLDKSKLHDVTTGPRYSSYIFDPAGEKHTRKPSYSAGVEMAQRISIE